MCLEVNIVFLRTYHRRIIFHKSEDRFARLEFPCKKLQESNQKLRQCDLFNNKLFFLYHCYHHDEETIRAEPSFVHLVQLSSNKNVLEKDVELSDLWLIVDKVGHVTGRNDSRVSDVVIGVERYVEFNEKGKILLLNWWK